MWRQTVSCWQTQHNTATVALSMAEPDTAVIQLKPLEELQCPTVSPATCSITIKGYYRHSSILNISNWRVTRLPFPSTLSPCFITSPNPYPIRQTFRPFHLSIIARVTLFDLRTHPSLFQSLSLHYIAEQPLFLRCVNQGAWHHPPACLSLHSLPHI